MDANKKLALLANEFNSTIDHAAEVLEEYVNTMTEKILVDAFNELSVEDQMLVLLGMICEIQPEPKVDENKNVFDFDDEMWEALQRLVEK